MRETAPEEQQAIMVHQRIVQIEQALVGWRPKSEAAYEAWSFWRASNYQCLPYAGGYMDQPAWLLDEFAMFNLLDEFFRLQVELDDLSNRLSRRRR